VDRVLLQVLLLLALLLQVRGADQVAGVKMPFTRLYPPFAV
jgi:hypothetical protein